MAGDWQQIAWERHVPSDLVIPAQYYPDLSDSHDLVDLLNVLTIEMARTQSDRVSTLAESALEKVRNFVDSQGEHLMAQASLHVIETRAAFMWRLTLPQLQFRLLVDPDLDVRDAKRTVQTAPVLRSSETLLDGRQLLSLYVAPLIGALSPSVWGHACAIPGVGTLILGFGCALNGGITPLPTTLLGTIHTQTPTLVKRARVTSDSIAPAIGWWCDKLNSLFGVLTDPATFAGRHGEYDPVKHVHVLMTIEHLFRRVAAIQSDYENTEAIRALFFSAMDTFERVLGKKAEVLYSPVKARVLLDRLVQAVPAQAAPLILNAARRGVDALDGVENGFFLPGPQGRIPGRPGKDGTPKTQTPRDSVAAYLKLRRNAVHGFDPPKGADATLSRELLGRHTGELPDDLPLLAYLYLLDLLTSPVERLRKTLS